MTFTSDMDPRDLVEIAILTERHGLGELWVFEDCFTASAMPVVTAALAATTRLRVGIALAPVPLRNVALLAMDVASIDRMFPGRLLPGIGTGVLPWMAQIGEAVPSPMTRLRESGEALRRLLAGETVTTSGRYVTLTDVTLAFPPAAPLPIYVGANGPRMLALAGEIGDGTLLDTGLTDEQIVEKVAIAREAAHTAGKESHEFVLLHLTALGADADTRLAAGLARWGHPDAVPGTAGSSGSPADVAADVRRLNALGITSFTFMPTPDVASPADLAAFIRTLGDEVAPLVRAP
jgi:5,10-methylenetetrahydromethanopterin reductase